MIYAPILITTLNRVDHLKRCIESLSVNPWAKYSPLMISVDYPLDDGHADGYSKICGYLKEGIKGFKSVEIIYQKFNLGLVDNSYSIFDHVKKTGCDRFIYIEDDIEVSPNFIEYMDRNLEVIQDKKDVLAVCATRANRWPCVEQNDNNNVLLTCSYSGCAFGMYIEAMDCLRETISEDYLKNAVKDKRFRKKLIKEAPELIFSLQDALIKKKGVFNRKNGEIPIVDVTIKVYLMNEDSYVLSPYVSKACNGGYDGSGYDCPDTGVRTDVRDRDNRFEPVIRDELRIDNPLPHLDFEQWLRIQVALIKLFFVC